MSEHDFIPTDWELGAIESEKLSGAVSWQSPSNIAIIKYWGKRDQQIPENPSISFTLTECRTITKLTYQTKAATDDFDFEVYLDGQRQEDFEPKIRTFFQRTEVYLPFLKHFKFKIETKNTFPHSSGIASSASGMSALALCLVSLEQVLTKQLEARHSYKLEYFNQKASFLARLGSGSACRSIEGPLVVWGRNDSVDNSSDLVGIKYPYDIHDNFKEFQDTILLVDKGEKQVSSTVGHQLMHGHPFAKRRFEQAHESMGAIKNVLRDGDLDAFIELMESEALTLHSMMMTSRPYFILMKPNTLEIINRIWNFRKSSGLHVGFTLDAGANVHVLYPKSEAAQILEFIKSELLSFCQNEQFIVDKAGKGASQINL